MELFVEEEPRLGMPPALGLGEDAMEAVRKAFPGQDFAIDAVNRAFGLPDPVERSRRDSSTCGVSGSRAIGKHVDLEAATNSGKSSAEHDSSACGIHGPSTSEKLVNLGEAANAGKSCAQQDSSACGIRGPCASENGVGSELAENAGQRRITPPTPADVGDEAGGGWNRRVRRGRIPDEREPDANRVSALEKALTGFAERQTDAVVNPTVATCFDSVAEAYDFYNLYSWEMGFGIRYGKSRSNAMGSKSMQEIVCSREGKPKKNVKSPRCDCTALIRLLRTDDNGWYVTEHRQGHTHAFSKTCRDKLQWPSHKHIDKYTRDLVRQLRENNVNLGVYNTIASFFGRVENPPFTKCSIRTLCGKISREQADDDARKTMETAAAVGEKDTDNHTREETPFNCWGLTSTTLDSVNMPVDFLRYPEQDDTQRNAEADRLANLMVAFGDCHLVLKNCTYDDLINSNGTMSDLEKAVKAVTPLIQQGIFGDLWSKAHNSGGVVSAQVLTIRDLFRFKRWLTTTTGQHNVRSVQERVKLGKTGNGVFEPEQTALLRLYQAENDERSREMSKLQGERDAKIAYYMAKIDEACASFEVSVEAAKVDYPVSASYVPLDINELRGQCWTVYLALCQKEGKDLNTKATNIVEKFGSEVQQRHLFEFCSREANRQALLKYGLTKVKKLKEAGVARGESTFRGYMALLDIEKDYALLAAEEQVASDPDTRGDGDDEDRSDRDNAAARDEAARGDGEDDDGEDAPEAPPRQKRRKAQSILCLG